MIYIIDGKNLYHYWGQGEFFAYFDRASAFFAGKNRGNAVTLFMDGGPPENYPDEFSYKGMRIIFTPGVQADERIKERIKYLAGKPGVTVVTNDKELLNYALRYELKRLPCYKLVRKLNKPADTDQKEKIKDRDGIDQWLKKKWKIE